MTYRYQAFGLTIHCSFPLPELTSAPEGAAADVLIREGALPSGPSHYQFRVEEEIATLWIPDSNATYRMLSGRELIVDSRGQDVGRNVRLYLLGSAIGAILHQRGLLPLHACALEFNGKAVAFLGRSGAGKSTLAAWLSRNGGRLLSDDVCVVRSDNGRFMTSAGIPRLRLWRDALEARGDEPRHYARSFDGWDKYDVPHAEPPIPEAFELTALFELSEGRALDFRSVSGAEAVQCLAANTYRGSYVHQMGRTAEHFQQCIELARALPIEQVVRPKDYSRIEQDYARILERVRQLTA